MMRTGSRKAAVLAIAFVFALAGPAMALDKAGCAAVESIGVATMASDGAITLHIRSLPPGPIAEGTLRYAPGDPRYDEIKRHLGGIMPGESKPVRPWC